METPKIPNKVILIATVSRCLKETNKNNNEESKILQLALNYLYTFLCLIHFVISSVITKNKTKLKRVYIFKLIDKWHVQKKKKKKKSLP